MTRQLAKRRFLAAIVVAAVAVAASAVAGNAYAGALDRFYQQKVAWQPCDAGGVKQDCARVEVPVDWGNPAGTRRGGPAVLLHRHLTWSWTKPQADEIQDGTTLTVCAGCTALTVAVNCAADYDVEVPPEVEIVARVEKDLSIDGVSGPVTARTLRRPDRTLRRATAVRRSRDRSR